MPRGSRVTRQISPSLFLFLSLSLLHFFGPFSYLPILATPFYLFYFILFLFFDFILFILILFFDTFYFLDCLYSLFSIPYSLCVGQWSTASSHITYHVWRIAQHHTPHLVLSNSLPLLLVSCFLVPEKSE